MKASDSSSVVIRGVDEDGNAVFLKLGADGTLAVAATVDTSTLATAAKQDTLDGHVTDMSAKLPTSLGAKAGAASLSVVPATDSGLATAAGQAALAAGFPSAIVKSDTTDVTALCTKGLLVTVTGTLAVQGVTGGAPSGVTVDLGTQAAGTYISIACGRVMATGTTATVVGLS